LINPTAGSVVENQVADPQATATQLGLRLLGFRASNDSELETAFADMKDKRAGGLIITAEPFANIRIAPISALAWRFCLPAIVVTPQCATLGGLMSYGGTILETHHLAGGYVGRILKGEKPADLPVIQGTKVELIVNLKTAKALGITLPMSLLGR